MNKVLALYGGGAVLAVLALYVLTRTGVLKSLTTNAIGAVGSVASGTVIGIGELVGIPATDTDQCTRDIASGNAWQASFSCPAGRFIKASWPSTSVEQQRARDMTYSDPYGLENQIPSYPTM